MISPASRSAQDFMFPNHLMVKRHTKSEESDKNLRHVKLSLSRGFAKSKTVIDGTSKKGILFVLGVFWRV